MIFTCEARFGRKTERWHGTIVGFKKYESHYEIRINSRSSITVVFGKTTLGGFACMPDFGAGCHLADLKNRFWNTEQLTKVLGKVDGITVSTALCILSDQVKF